MNTASAGYSLIAQRKTAVAFRDASLLAVFRIGITSLRQLQAEPGSDAGLREAAVGLVLKCLSYDFVGTTMDESAEDVGTIQARNASCACRQTHLPQALRLPAGAHLMAPSVRGPRHSAGARAGDPLPWGLRC